MENTWRTGVHDGYYTKTIRVGNCTIEINRPILTADEQAKREEAVKQAMIIAAKAAS